MDEVSNEEDAGQLVLMSFDNITVGFPQSHIVFIENLSQVRSPAFTINSSGYLTYESIDVPVYTFNCNLELLTDLSIDNKICVLIKKPDNSSLFSVMCRSIEKFTIKSNTIKTDVPYLMKNDQSPVNFLLRKDNELILLCDGISMGNYIEKNDQLVEQELGNA